MDNMEMATIRPGALCFALQIARFAGVAPLNFQVLRNSYKISVTRYQEAYCLFIPTVFNILALGEVYFKYKRFKMTPRAHSVSLLDVTENALCILASAIGYMGSCRMKNMIHQLNILEKIRNKINYEYKIDKFDKNLIKLCTLLISMYIILMISDNTLSALRASIYDMEQIVYAVNYIEYIILLLITIQITVLNFEAYKVLRALNEKLRYLLALTPNGNQSINAKTQMVNNEIRSLTHCYISICEVARQINKFDGIYMLLIYVCSTVFGVFNGYRLILALNRLTNVSYRWLEIIIRSNWCILVVVRTTFFVEPYQRISCQVAEMTVLLTKLKLQMTPLGKSVSVELDIMIKQVTLNVPQYSPLGLLTLNRSLVTITFSAIITYLLFVIQIELNK